MTSWLLLATSMDILLVFKFSFLLFVSTFLIHQLPLVFSESVYTPTDLIFLSCGSSGDGTEDDRRWMGDMNSKYSPLESSSVNKSMVANADKQPKKNNYVFPYKQARVSQSQFTYNFNLTPGPKFVRLYFFPSTYQSSNKNFSETKGFVDITAGIYTLLRNFSALLSAGDWKTDTFCKEYNIFIQDNQKLNVSFSPFFEDSSDTYAFVNAIEIVSMPTYLHYSNPNSSGITVVGEKKQFHITNDTALEMYCRVNIGYSRSLLPKDDTGMYRVWASDVIFFYPLEAPLPKTISTNASVNYSKIQAYTAPDIVYRTARSIGSSKLENLTWEVIVDQGYKCLVRLHFCEIDPRVRNPGDRLIVISMNDEIVDSGFDILGSSGGQMIPIYKDYIVTGPEKAKSDAYELLISLKPNASSVYDDVILNGFEVFKLSNSRNVLVGGNADSPQPPPPVPVILPPPPASNSKSSNRKTLITVICACAPVLLIVISLLSCWIVTRRRQRKGKHWDYRHESLTCCWLNFYKWKSTRSEASALPTELCRYFSLSEIRAATKNFDDEMVIGKGGFGKVFKGEIDGGAETVAIKRLSPDSEQGTREFETEIKLLSQLRHFHLVSLIGYCYQDSEMILVYEFMPKGTLQDHLHGAGNDPLTWKQRLEICIGSARGLNYLHTGAERTVIHRDVKTTNILLDENWTAKVSDFGLSKLGMDNNPINTRVVGTRGYLDLEYATRSQLTEKSDVYSFGVVLLEVLSGRKALNNKLEDDQRNLAIWAKKCIQNGTIHEIVDPYLVGKIAPECFDKFVEIAERCVRDRGIDRPNMHDVTEMLEFALQLQKTADAKKTETNPDSEVVYPELVYHPPRYNTMTVIRDTGLVSFTGTELDSSTTIMSNATVESSIIVTSENCNFSESISASST